MMRNFQSIKTYLNLGVWNLLSVSYYRLQLKTGFFEKKLPIDGWSFQGGESLLPKADEYPVSDQRTSVIFFNSRVFECESPPDWFVNPYVNTRLVNNQAHWSCISDFEIPAGDIKTLWEMSRFDWLIKACWQIRENGISPLPINNWLDNWCLLNPINKGVNWKCAQEASIRGMNLVLCHVILAQKQRGINSRFSEFLVAHIERILPTVGYARAQNNNHGTSEGAALFVMGIVLSDSVDKKNAPLAVRALSIGRTLLEERVGKLIANDGLFSQYSVNYHRMMLDTLSFVELIRRHFGIAVFSKQYTNRAKAATSWLIAVTDPISGDAPNIGANDGSQLFNLKGTDFRDFRESCELGANIFLETSIFEDQVHGLSEVFLENQLTGNEIASLINDDSAKASSSTPRKVSPILTHGFRRIGNTCTFAILKVPHDRFRPSQADSLHIDIWHDGTNFVRDAGTYSYNPPASFKSDLGDTRYHSTVELDGRNQMNKISRFLYTGWLRPLVELPKDCSEFPTIYGAYIDYKGASHSRSVDFDGSVFTIIDKIQGCKIGAKLRFRLSAGFWKHIGQTVQSAEAVLTVEGENVVNTSLLQSIESRYYLEYQEIPVFEVALSGDSVTTTKLRFVNNV